MAENTDSQPAPQHVGVLLVTHGEFGEALLSAAQLILGPQEGVSAVSVLVSRAVEDIVVELKTSQAQLDQGKGVLILTDLFGGTPTTLSLSLLKGGNVEVVSGVNLPMLIKSLQSRGLPLAELANQAREAGQKGIVVPGEMLRKKTTGA
jgi:PTS system mannose-specific IIA component